MNNVSTTSIVLGIDVGTSGTKALAIDGTGAVLTSALATYPVSTPRAGYSEQSPDDWFVATIDVIQQLLNHDAVDARRVVAIGLTGQMHGLVPLDKHLEVIRPAILWNDQRSAPQCEEVTRTLGLETLLQYTGNQMLPGFTAPKALWMRKHEPEAYARIQHILLPKDYVRFRLGHELVMDVSDASGTSVFDCGKRTWSKDLLDALELPHSWWPDAAESCVVVDHLNKDVAAKLGLPESTPLIAGAGDQAASAVGTGIINEGIVSATLGTSGVVFAASKTWRTAPNGSLHAFCHAVPDTWHLMGVMLSAAGSYDWFVRTIVPDLAAQAESQGEHPFAALDKRAAATEPGAEGLFFLPYLSGERTPHADPNARGCFIGLTARHNRDHMTRAVLEGVTFGMRDCLDLVRASGVNPNVVRLSGGGAKGQFWRQMCADIFGSPTVTTTTTEGTAYGAALLAGVGGQIWDSVPDACSAVVRETDRSEPGVTSAHYDRLHKRFSALYPTLQTWWHQA